MYYKKFLTFMTIFLVVVLISQIVDALFNFGYGFYLSVIFWIVMAFDVGLIIGVELEYNKKLKN